MARKNMDAARVVASTSTRPPPVNDLAAERAVQNLRSLNSRLVSETVELRRQLQLQATMNGSADTIAPAVTVNPAKGSRRNRGAHASRYAATVAAAETTVNPAIPIAPAVTVNPAKGSRRHRGANSSRYASTIAAAETTVNPAIPIAPAASINGAEQEQSTSTDGCTVDHPIQEDDVHISSELEETVEKKFTPAKVTAAAAPEVREQSKHVGSEITSISTEGCTADHPIQEDSAGIFSDLEEVITPAKVTVAASPELQEHVEIYDGGNV